ncbi:MAG: HD domain-containing protein [Candidatus Aminicenantes bacterium]|jgi:HD superfamily phosphohydrolase
MEDKYRNSFKKNIGKVLSPSGEDWENVMGYWGAFIKEQSRKGLVPLFITGSGTSMGVNVPSIWGIIDYLLEKYEEKKQANEFQDFDETREVVENLFDKYKTTTDKKKTDRTIVASLLNAFQEDAQLKDKVWSALNIWLLEKILNANPTPFHENLAKLYRNVEVNAICLTLNFDGLLIRRFVMEKKRAFSLPTREECERFFLRPGNSPTRNKSKKDEPEKEYIEIQIRGDILYVKCNSKQFCPNKSRDAKHSLWANVASIFDDIPTNNLELIKEKLLKCPYCGEIGSSYLSFPGSYEKEKDMRQILEIVWRYLAFRISCVIVVGLSGEWDPLIVAFMGDLLSEREIPLVVIDKNARESKKEKAGESNTNNKKPDGSDNSYIVKELVTPGIHSSIAIGDNADHFSEKLVKAIGDYELPKLDHPDQKILYNKGVTEDQFWYKMIDEVNDSGTSLDSINRKFSEFELDLQDAIEKGIKLDNFAQIGLKSYWMGLVGKQLGKHNRLNHSIGVMKIASFLYEAAIKNSNLKENGPEKQFLRIAALLHDIGHLPFSHLIENVFDELGWRPGGYQNTYSHTFQTEKDIHKLFGKNKNLNNHLNAIGYTVKDIINLVNGCFGVGFLDAIINSPIDADKIDYIFRDTDSTGKKISLSPMSFLRDFASGIIITPEKFMAFSGNSAKAARDLLNTRLFVYNNLYLQPAIIILEGIVKLIIKTFFVHEIEIEGIETSSDSSRKPIDRPDLGSFKINFFIQKLVKPAGSDNETIEMKILANMFETLKKNKDRFCPGLFDNLEKGFKLVNDVKNEDELKKVESSIISKRFFCKESVLKDIIKKVILRIPGAAIIETSKNPNILSMSDSRKERDRSDGTKQFSECILVPGGDPLLWSATNRAEVPLSNSLLKEKSVDDIRVYFYPLSRNINDAKFIRCKNLFEKLRIKSGITSEPANEEV